MGKRLCIDEINQKIVDLGFKIESFQDNKYSGIDTICTFRCSYNHLFQRRLCNVIYREWNVYCPECKIDIIAKQKHERFEKIKKSLQHRNVELVSGAFDDISELCDIKCGCGNIFSIQVRSIKKKNRLCCKDCDNKHIHYNEAVHKFKELDCPLIIDKESFKNGTEKCKMFCKICKREYNQIYCNVVKKLTANKYKTLYLKCGCYKDSLCGQKFGELTVISNDRQHTKRGFLEKCRCSCGEYTYAYRTELLNNRRFICDHYHETRILNEKIKQFLLKQNIEMLTPFCGAKKRVKLKCNCGKIFKLTGNTLSQKFKKNEDVSCHNMVNGCMTSKKAVQLHRLITDFGIHNFKSKKCGFIDIAFVYQGRKIAIEYDEWFWHRKNLVRDKRKTKKLIDNNWLVVRFLASDDLPNIKDIWDAIDKLIKTNKKYILIKSKDWKGYD